MAAAASETWAHPVVAWPGARRRLTTSSLRACRMSKSTTRRHARARSRKHAIARAHARNRSCTRTQSLVHTHARTHARELHVPARRHERARRRAPTGRAVRQVKDLLDDSGTVAGGLAVVEDPKTGPYVKGAVDKVRSSHPHAPACVRTASTRCCTGGAEIRRCAGGAVRGREEPPLRCHRDEQPLVPQVLWYLSRRWCSMRTRLHMRVLCGAQTIICAVRMSYSAAAHVLAGFINARPRRGRVAVWLEACGATLRGACWGVVCCTFHGRCGAATSCWCWCWRRGRRCPGSSGARRITRSRRAHERAHERSRMHLALSAWFAYKIRACADAVV